MAESRAEAAQVIEVPARRTSSGMGVGNLLLLGGLGYALFRTFLLEERVNDLQVLIKRQHERVVVPARAAPPPREAYETSSDDEEEEEDEDEEEEDEVRIEEQPREVPPPEPPVQVASAFVNTRQRRSGSELRREASRQPRDA